MIFPEPNRISTVCPLRGNEGAQIQFSRSLPVLFSCLSGSVRPTNKRHCHTWEVDVSISLGQSRDVEEYRSVTWLGMDYRIGGR
jgi:hypothetical protein